LVHHVEQQIQVAAPFRGFFQGLLYSAAFGTYVKGGIATGEVATERGAALTSLHFGNATHEEVLGQLGFTPDVEAGRGVEYMAIRPGREGLGALPVFNADAKEAVVGLTAVADDELAEFAGEVGVAGVEVERFFEELADVRVGGGGGSGDDPGKFRAVGGDNAFAIGEGVKFFPSGSGFGRIPSSGQGFQCDTTGEADPGLGKIAAVAL
jgi:hypothetical protein